MKLKLIIIITFIACELNAQNYTRDGGVRIGEYFSAGYRHFMDDETAVEALLSAGRRGVKITFLKEHAQPAFGRVSENLFFISGFGAHVGFRYADRYTVINRTYELDEYRFMPLLGIDALIAIEYRFPDFPILMSLDFMPFFEYSTIQIFNVNITNIGFSLKYRF